LVPYDECCGRAHTGATPAATAEALMRSRYSAFAMGDPAYLLRSWHPSTRPATVDLDPGQRWERLEIVTTTGGGLFHTDGTVEFRAHYRTPDDRHGVMHEVSRFVREEGQWLYVDGRQI
jgi:SEC-C motif-containing protein